MIVRGAESDYDASKDPTRNKNEAQKVAENFFTFWYQHDYVSAARLFSSDINEDEKIKDIKEHYEKSIVVIRNDLKKEFNAQYISHDIEPETLNSQKAGGGKNESRIKVFYTERHEALQGGQKWSFFWQLEYIITINKDNKITKIKEISNTKLLMILKPENCIKPAVCD